MFAYELCRRYQRAVNARDMDQILDLFVPDAMATAPISGTLPVREFHLQLFRHNERGMTQLRNVFDGLMGERSIALQFDYTWTREGDIPLVLQGVTIFDLAGTKDKLAGLTMIYDASELRKYLAGQQASHADRAARSA
ncbi:nuclear transport factor 2 family protein [Noviherbaspirillum galbum]|uniref:Nuclear transport factor 2 family protein n=1 Tax=Noviherbaspirillum galbum TaxID=2709383 RepID=A0A6B3SFB8_9BURK|nr:nuclear transport factor 2 family protein [Noviherbaspirillum galbum]NEX59511.1 nuclear transport factor 2 family protein [Noviherbaspirillum galbum]